MFEVEKKLTVVTGGGRKTDHSLSVIMGLCSQEAIRETAGGGDAWALRQGGGKVCVPRHFGKKGPKKGTNRPQGGSPPVEERELEIKASGHKKKGKLNESKTTLQAQTLVGKGNRKTSVLQLCIGKTKLKESRKKKPS